MFGAWPRNELSQDEISDRRFLPTGAAISYGVVASLWIVYSDAVLEAVVSDTPAFAAISSSKGLLFVALTSALLFYVLRKMVAAQAKSADALSLSRRLQADILDALPDAVFTLDAQAHIKTWNRQSLAATGYTPEDVADKNLLAFVAPHDKARTNTALTTALAGRLTSVRVDALYKDGTTVPYLLQCTPLKSSGNQVIGILCTGHNVSEEVRNEDALRRSLSGYQHILEQAIGAIAAIVEHRDRYLAGHQERVTQLATAIAKKMKLGAGRLRGLQLASSCHDIGKIHVPAEILSKPGSISAAEFAMIKTHPRIGYDILRKIDFPWPIAEIVHQHHERYDGSGYPQGLAGDAIRLEAQILGVADVIEAMTSHRPYRPGLGADTALEEIRRGRGTLYNPQVVDACLAVFADGRFEFQASEKMRAAS